MTIEKAIKRVDELVHNEFPPSEKIAWLSNVDWMVKNHILDNHEGAENIIFNGYHEEIDSKTVLLVPEPYDKIYLYWLEAQIHLYTGEYDKYSNAITLYNTEFDAYSAHYTCNHMPQNKGRRFLF